MTVRINQFFAICLVTILFSQINLQAQSRAEFTLGNKAFLLDGKPFLIRAGELHYSRIPKEYWEHRIQMCKAMGMNTICIYIFWNYHEQKQGVYDFSGEKDITEFVKLIQKNGMYCIIRPGPYVCAEWDMGGLPWWLLKKDDIRVRTKDDPLFMSAASKYLFKVAGLLAPYQIQNGGNIIMAQVENEYGVWGKDEVYMSAIRDVLRKGGLDKVQLFRCDWSSNFSNYNVNGVASTLNFGAGANINQQFKKFRELNPQAPLMCSEYWTGWFDAWGKPHQTRSVESFIGSLKDMMEQKISFSLYMAHGGTSFGQWAGANTPPYAPDVTSYDYNAPIDEGGKPTEKFYAIRELLKNYLNEGEVLADIPPMPSGVISIPPITFTQTAKLFENLPTPVQSHTIRPMEYLDQGWGSVLYSTFLTTSTKKRKLIITDVHDYALIYVNNKLIGKLDRRIKENEIVLPPVMSNSRLDILVETEGRVNYGEGIIDRKGITQKVEIFDGELKKELFNWNIYKLPVDYAFQKNKKFKELPPNGPSWYKGTFTLEKIGDTYIDMSGWNKGMVWVNGHNLGRYWQIGPVQTLYIPAPWLNRGANEIIVTDVLPPAKPIVKGLETPILDQIISDESTLHRKKGQMLDLSSSKPMYNGEIGENGWQDIELDGSNHGRYFCLEVLNSYAANDSTAAIAELQLIGQDGKVISTLDWDVLYADSENISESQTADRLFDNQETVIWQTAKGGNRSNYPHAVVIDLGKVFGITKIKLLQRVDKRKEGRVKKVRAYLQQTPFKM